MVLLALHYIATVAYVIVPPAALVGAFVMRSRFGRGGAVASISVAFIAALAVAVALNLVYATAARGRASLTQIAIAAYFATGMILLLRLFDTIIRRTLRRLLRLHREDSHPWRRTRDLIASLTRVAILFAVGLPFVMASVMIYRPKVAPLDDPQIQLGFDFQRVEFRTSDGLKIVAWWIPAQQPLRRARSEDFGKQTAILCHGLAASKSNQLIMARRLIPGGYNVLAFDFRAHGESGGQLTTFGALEKRDVLAAVAWLRDHHPDQSERIVGVGASMGAAALISAAADDSPNGRAIDAIACYACYDDLWDMAQSTAHNYFSPPLDWLLLHIGLPLAAGQTGADLIHYSPARDAASLWPRPILLIHGERDEIIDFSRGQALLDAASQPKFHIWYPIGSHNDIITDETAARIVLEFFRTAKPLPVI